MLHFAGEGEDFVTCRPAEIYQDESLPGVYPYMAVRITLQTGPVDQPSGGQFHLFGVGGRVVRHIGMEGQQSLGLLTGDNRILEEAACIARFGRVGQLGAPDLADRIADVAQRDASPLLHLAGYVSVIEARHGAAAQLQADRGDD